MSRKILEELEKEGMYVFHGSGDKILGSLEPHQAFNHKKNGDRTEDDKPAIHVSHHCDVAIFMALINKENCPKGYYSGFSWDEKNILYKECHPERSRRVELWPHLT